MTSPLRIHHGLLAALLISGCSSADPTLAGSGIAGGPDGPGGPSVPDGPVLATGEAVTAPATVRYSPIEGGCWALEVEGHGHYQPLTLPAAFQQANAPVTVTIRSVDGVVGFCPHPYVLLDSIAPR